MNGLNRISERRVSAELNPFFFLCDAYITDNKDISPALISRKKIPLTTKYASTIINYLFALTLS